MSVLRATLARKGKTQKAARASPTAHVENRVEVPRLRTRSGSEATTTTSVVMMWHSAVRARTTAAPAVNPLPSRTFLMTIPR